jgi:hypothetical protein
MRTFSLGELDALARDHQTVQGESATRGAGYDHRVRLIGLPVQESDHRALAIGCAQLQAFLPFAKFDVDRFRIDPVIIDLDDGMRLIFLAPPFDRFSNGIERALLAYPVELGLSGLGERSVIFSSADICAEGIAIGHPNAVLRRVLSRKGDTSKHRIDGHRTLSRQIGPVG